MPMEYTAMISRLMNPTDRRTICCFQIRKTEVKSIFSGTLVASGLLFTE
jgi:hypothetical protein